ncbi:MAG TPA: MFS transporter, partial [Hyphomicrobiaceae bacterium]|nr:MFS transporter [Hyphomicrobiaceae bacterium]
GWLLASQLALLAAIVFLATRDPATATLSIGLGALLVAAASATQDIVIDAFRIESLDPDQQAAGMASYVAAYRVGMLVSGAGVIGVTAWLEAKGYSKGTAWTLAFVLAGATLVVGMLATLLSREPAQTSASLGTVAARADRGTLLARFLGTAIGAFTSFLTRKGAIVALLFVLLYKLCDAVAGVMTGPFVLSLGYDKATYAGIVKGVGLAATLIGGFAGGLVARALPLVAALWLGAILQMASNLVFVWLGTVTPSVGALTVAIVAENLAGGIGTVIFVAYLSALCSSPAHTATHYALLTALASTGRTFIAAFSGYAAKSLGWPGFFLMTVVLALPSLAVLVWLIRGGHFAALGGERRDGA